MIKLRVKELRKKSEEDLLKIKKTFQEHIMKVRVLIIGSEKQDKGVNIAEEKRNIARINTVLRERANG